MNKSELIDAVANAGDLNKADASRAVDGVIAAVTEALKSGDQITIVGFGTFLVRQREARSVRRCRDRQVFCRATAHRSPYRGLHSGPSSA